MAVSTFQSRWGNYLVTRAELACPVAVNTDGVSTQSVLTFETATFPNDDQQPVRVTGATLFRHADGRQHVASYEGQQRTLSRERARKQYRAALQQGYSPAIERLF
jgi:hypothetical protein